ncbi:MAG TPA: choline transporter, partial [Rhodospirillaceae bacterium]|nr:choline transporter [Rhodospirillaceae bacterium]
ANVIPLSLWSDAQQDTDWQGNWTAFYWGWWIAWAPFVGMFIARISRGRTIREFTLGVLLVPT